jgi:hypothetical protein
LLKTATSGAQVVCKSPLTACSSNGSGFQRT